ncbi:MAG TPA: NAD(P)/FAD-dependent oxidoreductase [Candidatus Dormibacteraeota bacterium]|nr:NAD(P)/FAD-dependent oxidoreductase [Candidatus Dormibacteraeota bacterium]
MIETEMVPEASSPTDAGPAVAHFHVAVIGTGFAGLGMAIRLKQRGMDDFVVLERAADLGGTWRDNTYPGCQCDVPSHLYSFSFAPKPGWSRTFSRQPEIWDYLRDCAHRHGILPHIRFRHEVLEAAWDDAARLWRIETSGGACTARFLVAGMGGLSEPAIPDLPGLSTFAGTAFHSAAWDHGHDLAGRRVAVIGTGASAIQFVPLIQPEVARLHLYQRTPPWVLPHHDREVPTAERRLFALLPLGQRLARIAIYLGREGFLPFFTHRALSFLPERIARRHLARQVPDPALRARLTPGYAVGCKRILLSNDYYPALVQPNVEVVGEGIREVRPGSIVSADGTEREVDTIIFATGFQVVDMPAARRIRGRGGRTLEEAWEGSPRAYLGTTTPGFPNLFLMLGPNTGLGHTSVVLMIECQIDYILSCLDVLARRRLLTAEVLPEAEAAYNRRVQARMRGTVWTTGGCASWYLDRTGRNTTLWPGSTLAFRRLTRRFDPRAYALA